MTDQAATVNKNILRMSSLLTLLVLLAALFSYIRWLALLLCIDALIRSFAPFSFSPLYRAARAHIALFRIKPKPVEEAPYRFAAKIEAALFAIISALAFANLLIPANYLTELVVLMVGLNALAGINLGTKLYDRLNRSK